ncbi:MAG: hypothetical protein R6X08_02530 [Desulfosalsimonadaceae bacterium]
MKVINVGFLSGGGDPQFREQKWEVFDEQIKQKIFAKIGVNPDRSQSGEGEKE